MDDFNDSVLLSGGHFVVTGEAEAAAEDVGTDVGAGTGDIGIGLAAAAALGCDEGMGAVNRLQVHRLPDGAALGVEGRNGREDFAGRGLAGFVLPEFLLLPADMRGHGVRVDDQAAEPEVGHTLLRVIGVHADRQVLQAFFVSLIDRFLLGDVLIQIGKLTADDAGDDVGHAVVVTDLFVLVPGGCFARLGGPFADLVGVRFGVGQEHTAGRAGDDLVAVEGDAVIIAEGTGLDPLIIEFVFRAERFGGIFDNQGAVGIADGSQFFHPAGCAVEMGNDNELYVRIERKGFLQSGGRHVPGVIFGVDEDRLAVLIGDGIDGCIKGYIGAEDLVAG